MTESFHRAEQLLREINHTHGFEYTLLERCRGGVIGAWLLAARSGDRAVLKCNDGMAHRITRLPPLVDRVRTAGYPTPAWLAAGVTAEGGAYHLVDFAPGEPMSNSALTVERATALVSVIEKQVGLNPDPAQNWSPYVKSAAFGEEAGDPRPVVRGIGRPGAQLLEHFDTVLAPYKAIELPEDDMVHGDFNTCNVLVQDGGISAVIDIDACGSGTRAVDYAWLLREAYVTGAEPEAIHMIRRAGEQVAGPGVLTVCVAATAFDIIRFQHSHDPDSVPGVLTGLHRLAEDMSDILVGIGNRNASISDCRIKGAVWDPLAGE